MARNEAKMNSWSEGTIETSAAMSSPIFIPSLVKIESNDISVCNFQEYDDLMKMLNEIEEGKRISATKDLIKLPTLGPSNQLYTHNQYSQCPTICYSDGSVNPPAALTSHPPPNLRPPPIQISTQYSSSITPSPTSLTTLTTTTTTSNPARPKKKRKQSQSQLQLNTCAPYDPSALLFQLPNEIHSSIELASKYANYYAYAINNDCVTFPESLLAICSTDLKVDLNICQLIRDTNNSINKNHFGNFQEVCLSAFDFIKFVQNIQILAPDSILKIVSCNACQIGDEFVYMAIFQYTGTIICEDAVLVTTDHDGKLVHVTTAEAKLMKQDNQRALHEYKAIGSITLRRKRNEKIHKMEFFYEFVQ